MVDACIIKDFFELLNNNSLKYVLIKNDDNVLPDYLESDSDIDFLIHPNDYYRLIEIITDNGYEKKIGESCKRYFLEQLKEDLLFRKEDCYFHFYEVLSCSPLTNMGDCKLPLSSGVQEYIWRNRIWDSDNKWWIMDNTSILLYLIVRSVFDKKNFRDKYIREIEKRIMYIDEKDFFILAEMIFFGFTPIIIEMVKKKQYDKILSEYLSYKDY